jgi:septum formation protein
MSNKIILASKSKVRKEILDKHHILCEVKPSNVDEDVVKESLTNELATPEIISKNLAELKANKVSLNQKDKIVLGADSVIDLDGELISKPESREEALVILKKLNGKKHHLISSVCISKNGSMIWNYTDKAELNDEKIFRRDFKSLFIKNIR